MIVQQKVYKYIGGKIFAKKACLRKMKAQLEYEETWPKVHDIIKRGFIQDHIAKLGQQNMRRLWVHDYTQS